MDINESFDFVIKYLNELPDSTGMVRCVLTANIFRVVKSLKDQIEADNETQKEERLKLEARIMDLEEEISRLKAKGKEE